MDRGRRSGGHDGSGGAVEGAVAVVAAMDSQALSRAAGDRKAIAEDQSAADGPPAESAEDAAATADLRAHQAGLSAQAPHSGEDRSLGRGDSWFHGSGSGFAFRQFRQRRV